MGWQLSCEARDRSLAFRNWGQIKRVLGKIMNRRWWVCNDELVKRVRWRDVKETVYENGYMAF